MMWIVVVLVVGMVVAALVLVMRGRRTRRLQGSFGREYDRTVAKAGDQGDAESELVKRQDRRERLTIVPLTNYRVLFEQILEPIEDHSAAPSDPRPDTLKVGGR